MVKFMTMSILSIEDFKVKKRNRLQKLTPKKHEIKTISGRSTYSLQDQIMKKAIIAKKNRKK